MSAFHVAAAVIFYVALAALAFRVGIEWAMAAISRGAYWRLTADERGELDRLIDKALGKEMSR